MLFTKTSALSSLPFLQNLLPENGEHPYDLKVSMDEEGSPILYINLLLKDTEDVVISTNMYLADLLAYKAHWDNTIDPDEYYIVPSKDEQALGSEIIESIGLVKEMLHELFGNALYALEHLFSDEPTYLAQSEEEAPDEDKYKPLSSY